MNARKSEFLARFDIEILVRRSHLTRLHVGPANKPQLLIEKQITTRFALTHEQRCKVARLMHFVERRQIEVRKNIDIMHQKRRVGIEQRLRVTQSTARLKQQFAFVGDSHTQSKIVRRKIVDNLIGKMMHIHHRIRKTSGNHFLQNMRQQRFPSHRHKRFWHIIGERTQARSQPRSKDYTLHVIAD